jgi:glucuronate isomerase
MFVSGNIPAALRCLRPASHAVFGCLDTIAPCFHDRSMFTTEPSLIQRIERMISETPIVDPHTHIRCDGPSAPDLASLMSYHWLQTELRAVGMPIQDLDPALPADERVRRSIPYLKLMRTTAMAWCFYRILRDLFDFHDADLTESNAREPMEKITRAGREPNWARTVLQDRCNIRTVVTSLGNRSADPRMNPDYVLSMLDLHYLFCPGVATDLTPFFAGRTTKAEYYEALAQVLGERPATVERLARLLRDWLEATVRGPVRFSNTFLPIEQRFSAPDVVETGRVLARAAAGKPLSDDDVNALVQFVTWQVLGWHHDQKKAFQIAVGAEYFICDGKSIPRFQETWTSQMARVFHHFGNVRFDLMMASDVLAHEVAVLARQFPNVYVSGYWWHNFFPATIEKNVALRIQIVPMAKITGFLCDAYYVEWSYGKLQVVKKAMAGALARLVETGYYEEDEIPPILKQILHDTPRDLYELGPTT